MEHRRQITRVHTEASGGIAFSYDDGTHQHWWNGGDRRIEHRDQHVLSVRHSVNADGHLVTRTRNGAQNVGHPLTPSAGTTRIVDAARSKHMTGIIDTNGTLWATRNDRYLIGQRLCADVRLPGSVAARFAWHGDGVDALWVIDRDQHLWRVDLNPHIGRGDLVTPREVVATQIAVNDPFVNVTAYNKGSVAVDNTGTVWQIPAWTGNPADRPHLGQMIDKDRAADATWFNGSAWTIHDDGTLRVHDSGSNTNRTPPGVAARRFAATGDHGLLWWVDTDGDLWATSFEDATARLGHPDDPMFATFWALYDAAFFDISIDELADTASRIS